MSDKCVTFLESLSRPLSQEKSDTAIHLFARNLEADMYNFVKLGELPGEMVSFASEDEGSHQNICFVTSTFFGKCTILVIPEFRSWSSIYPMYIHKGKR